jgi:uncharacterized protein YgiM (DUF1202 family)
MADIDRTRDKISTVLAMKRNSILTFALLLCFSLPAQQATNVPAPATPQPAPAIDAATPTATTNAPVATPEKKNSTNNKSAQKKSEKKAPRRKHPGNELRSVPLTAGQATVIASNVNVRGQAKLKSEVITRLNKGQTVSVLEEVTLKNSGPDEPSAWAKIILPQATHVWVNAAFIDATNKTVVPKKLKLRGGPGENYSYLGLLKQGDEVKSVGAKGDWMEIEAPAEACAFVAAQYLKQEPAGAAVAASTEPVTEPATLTEPPLVVTTPPDVPVTNTPPADETTSATNTPPSATDEPPPKRVVQREGFVRGTFSIQAPTRFELVSPENGRPVNYLHTTSRELDLQRYKGMRIIVTGEEGLDARWRNTPVITISEIKVVE